MMPASFDRVFHALAHPTRRAMLERLAVSRCNITELAMPFSITYAAAAKHVLVLQAAGLVRRKVQGRSHEIRIRPLPLAEAYKWIGAFGGLWRRVHHVL